MNIATVFMLVSMQFGLPPGLLSSLCYVESSHKVDAIHRDDGRGNSVGVCQVKYDTAKWMGFKGSEKDLLNPDINIYYAGKYLAHQRNRYKSVTKAVIAYNIGHAGYLTTTRYQAKVFEQWRRNE